MNALIVSLVIGATSAVMLRQAEITEKSTRYPRIRQLMNNVEIRMRTLSLSPTAYQCTDPNVRDTTTCSIRTNLFEEFNTTIAGADCPGGGTCGIQVMNQRLESGASTVNAAQQLLWYVARLEYFGEEIGLKPREVRFEVPFEVLQADVIQCPAATPIFAGFDARGNMICRALSADCPPGQYLSQVNPNTLQGTCVSLGSPISAPAGQMISGVNFSGSTITPVLTARKAPLSYFNYTPSFTTNNPNAYGPVSAGGSLGTIQVGGPLPVDVMCVAGPTTTVAGPTTTVAGPTTTLPSAPMCGPGGVSSSTCANTCPTGYSISGDIAAGGPCFGGGARQPMHTFYCCYPDGTTTTVPVTTTTAPGCVDDGGAYVPVGGMYVSSGLGLCPRMQYSCECFCTAPGSVNCDVRVR